MCNMLEKIGVIPIRNERKKCLSEITSHQSTPRLTPIRNLPCGPLRSLGRLEKKRLATSTFEVSMTDVTIENVSIDPRSMQFSPLCI